MMTLSRIIPTSFIRWVENLPVEVMLTVVACVILLVIVFMVLVIRNVNSQDSPSSKPDVPAKPPVTPASQPIAVSAPKMPASPAAPPVSKPQPATPVQPAAMPVGQSMPEISPKPAPQPMPAAKPLPTTPVPPAVVPVLQSAPQVPAKQEPVPTLKPAPAPVPAPVAQPLPTISVESAPIEMSAAPESKQPPVLDALIYKKIAALGTANKTVLFAGAGLEHLPVTIPVQTAVKLAGGGKKVLLIDLDMRRNAIAKVFDPQENTVKSCSRPKPLPSPVQNLSFWPADFFVRFAQMNLRVVIQSASAEFDLILVNAPYLDGHPDRKLIASSARRGLIFCKTKPQFERLQTLLTMGECQLLEPNTIEC